MIRLATKYDKKEIIEMMKLFREEADLPEYKDTDNEVYWNQMLDSMLAGSGVIFIEENKGLIMAVISPTVWCNKTYSMHELAWYVRPEHRNTTIGYRLFVSYLNYGKKLKEEGRIKYFTVSKMDTSPDLNYQKFGFRFKDENWIQ